MSSVRADTQSMATRSAQADVDIAARLFHGLSDRTRLSILRALLEGERPVREIVDVVGSSQSNVSNHLACLRECGLVVDRPGERRQVFYAIAHPAVVDLLRASERLLADSGHKVELCENPMMGGA